MRWVQVKNIIPFLTIPIHVGGVGALKTVAISHGDLDGVVSAALIARYTDNVAIRLSATSALPKVIESAMFDIVVKGADTIIISDLNPNIGNYRRISDIIEQYIKAGVKVVWLDHHNWPEGIIDEYHKMGVEVIVDTKRVAAEIVLEYLSKIIGEQVNDKYAKALVELAIDDDKFLNRNPLTVKWRRLLRWYNWEFRRRTVKAFALGDLWPSWAQEAYDKIKDEYEYLLSKTIENTRIVNVKGYRLVVIPPPSDKIHPGDIQLELARRGISGDIYVIIYSKGISLRSTSIDVSTIARALGGGGHAYSAGAPIETVDVDSIVKTISEHLS